MGQEEGFRHLYISFICAGLSGTVAGFLIGLELITFVVLLSTELQSHVGENAEHSEVAYEGKTVHRILYVPSYRPRRIEITVLERSASVYAHNPIIVGLHGLDFHAIQVLSGHFLRQGEELLVQIYNLGAGDNRHKKAAHYEKQFPHLNSSSISTVHISSAFSITLIMN